MGAALAGTPSEEDDDHPLQRRAAAMSALVVGEDEACAAGTFRRRVVGQPDHVIWNQRDPLLAGDVGQGWSAGGHAIASCADMGDTELVGVARSSRRRRSVRHPRCGLLPVIGG